MAAFDLLNCCQKKCHSVLNLASSKSETRPGAVWGMHSSQTHPLPSGAHSHVGRQGCEQVRMMQDGLEGVCCKGGRTNEEGILSRWGIRHRRHWNWVLKDLHKRAFQVEEKQKWKLRACIRLGIFRVPTHVAGRSWAIVHIEVGEKSDHEEFWMPSRPHWLPAYREWLSQPAVPAHPCHHSGRNDPKGVSFNASS